VNAPHIAITTALTGDRSGYVIATMPPEGQEHLAPSARTRTGTVLVVGSIYRISRDDEPEKWRAWLYPSAGGDMAVTQSCDAVDADTAARLRERLRKRAGKGPWWSAMAAAETGG
jgi:hypothetical protein